MSSERKHLPVYKIDAFASKPFKGNPAAVCLLQDEVTTDITSRCSSIFGLRWFTPKNEVNLCGHATLASAAVLFTCKGNPSTSLTFLTKSGELVAKRKGDLVCIDLPLNPPSDKDVSDETKQNIAMEINFSDTAFVRPINPGSIFGLRWFTPKNEVNLCGHATLASAAVLFTCKGNPSTSLTFLTKSGELVAKRKGDLVCIDLPLNPPSDKIPYGVDKLIEICLGSCQPVDIQYTPGANKELLLRLPDSCSRQEFEQMSPNPSAMMNAYKTGEVMGVILTLKGSKENGAVDEDGRVFDFISRYFTPWNGIDEDPVTGAAHTVLSAYWSKVLGKTEMYARQCSKRGGNIEIKVRDDGRVELAGKARTVIEGKIFVD
ncbi:Phenazine biosynthesis-like domain-containing protein [Holothuria leucospilota]|uniref:Phenazine biosynthesis-like domain-containing protein n=1 Tax=Holothuria leucospilota TaxID=206669 RepID=A0A9Q0YL46_HOLLE|nr:Phenazine biosynthesis-like domain-containing protein [Holothuria leucospilota]